MNDLIYQNAEKTIISNLSGLIERAIDPYTQQITGFFKLDGLRIKLGNTLKDTVALLSAWGFDSDIPNKDARLRDVTLICAKRMCAQINEEIFDLYRENTEEMFFMIDFMAFSVKVADLLYKELAAMEERKKVFKKLALTY